MEGVVMTHLPMESRDVWGVRGPRYEIRHVCAHPFCRRGKANSEPLEKHHLWPRSFLRHQPTEWVKLPDGRIVQNCVYLCREHHQAVTENRARIVWQDAVTGDENDAGFYWGDETLFGKLNPQPRFRDTDEEDVPPSDSEAVESVTEPSRAIWVRPDVHQALQEIAPHEGEECALCKRRVPKKRKPTTPTSKVHSFRGPLDQADELDEILESAAKHMGVYEKSYWKHEVILMGAVALLQGPGIDES